MCRVTASTTPARVTADVCPGVGRPFAAADGSLVRLRPAGRPVSVTGLARLLDLVAGQPDPSIQLTSRAALQLRGLPDPLPPEAVAVVREAGLLPSTTHELVRNVVASPLSGLDGRGHADVRPLVVTLDRALCATPALSDLGGRFLFCVDDGRGDVAGEASDLGVVALPDGAAVVTAGSSGRGWRLPLERVVPMLVELAEEFVTRRARGESVWHVDELASPLGPAPTASSHQATVSHVAHRPLGAVGPHAVVGVPLGLLTRGHVAGLARVTDHVLVTPWRSLVVVDGAGGLTDLSEAGLVVDAGSPWARLHACTGLPGCRRSAIDTRAMASQLAPNLESAPAPGRPGADRTARPVHVSGCERRCGTPSTPFVDVLAPGSLDEALAIVRRADASARTYPTAAPTADPATPTTGATHPARPPASATRQERP
ncbi:precorrin-3B synthase [Terracoccus luteus]|uniref:Precorrin-3B synthase n=1 Tax=Terracoccus luteus TaxID=53356 RepID=A0A495Y4S9_9MICO|nr:precorrin-3B synthase [Terracoccus luteus]